MPQDANQQGTIRNILQNFNGIDSLKELFWAEQNYDAQNSPLPHHGGNDLVNDPILIATGGADSAFHIIYVHLTSDRLSLTTERRLITQLLRDHPYALFVFSNNRQPLSLTNSTPKATCTSISIFMHFRFLTPEAHSVSLFPIRGSMSAMEVTFRSSPSSTARSSRLSTISRAAPSPPPM